MNPFCHTNHHVCPNAGIRRRAGLTFYADQLAGLYGFPKPTGLLPAIAIIELGGGTVPANLAKACAARGIPVPTVTDVNIGSSNSPNGDPTGADGECELDVQVAVLATFGRSPIYMLWCPNSDAGFTAGVNWVAANAVAKNICALSISWGQAESGWSSTARAAMDKAFAAVATALASSYAASGDNGSGDGGRGDNVDYPASSPYCTGVGGTTGQIVGGELSETVWSDTGGGFSAAYTKPSWQAGIMTASGTRMVPDVAAIADPQTGYEVYMNGQWRVIGGTSAAAPLWAAFTACLAGVTNKRFGLMAQTLYELSPNRLHDVTVGSNGGFKASVGPDPCTGLGTPTAAVAPALGAVSAPPMPPVPVPIPTPAPAPLGSLILGAAFPAQSYLCVDNRGVLRRFALTSPLPAGTFDIGKHASAITMEERELLIAACGGAA